MIKARTLRRSEQARSCHPIALDADGVPLIPPTQASTDSLATVSSAITGLEFGAGTYRIQGLPPGQYLVEIQQVNPRALEGSGIGPLGSQFPLPSEEYYNGGRESNDSTDSAADYVPVFVTAGGTATGTDIILNGISSAAPALFSESEPNELTKKAQTIASIPAEITASAASGDASKLKMRLGSQSDGIEDLYSFTVTEQRTYFVILEPTSGAGDLDLYLFRSGVSKKKTNLEDPNLLGYSASASSSELVGVTLPPGKYYHRSKLIRWQRRLSLARDPVGLVSENNFVAPKRLDSIARGIAPGNRSS